MDGEVFMKIGRLCFAVLCILGSILCADEIKIGSGSAPAENIFKPIKAAFETSTGIKLSVVSTGPKAAFLDLDKGVIDAAAAGLSYTDWLAFMKKEGSEIANPDDFQAFNIGKDTIKVLVNKSNPIKSLSKDQLVAIFTGQTSNWKDLGGQDAPIIVVVARLTAANSFFAKKVLDDAPYVKDALEVPTALELKQNIQQTPEAIGIGPLSLADDSVGVPDIPEISRPITLITKGQPSDTVKKLLDYIKGDGKQFIKQ